MPVLRLRDIFFISDVGVCFVLRCLHEPFLLYLDLTNILNVLFGSITVRQI